MHAATRIAAALFERSRTGMGSTIVVSVHEAALDWAMFPTTGDLASACYNLYETSDGQWLAVGALEAKFWRGFCERIDRRDLVSLQHAAEPERTGVLNEIRAVLRTRTRAEWLERFAGDDVCLSVVNGPEEALADPHVQATSIERARSPAPALGADTDAVLDEAGIDERKRARLRAPGVV